MKFEKPLPFIEAHCDCTVHDGRRIRLRSRSTCCVGYCGSHCLRDGVKEEQAGAQTGGRIDGELLVIVGHMLPRMVPIGFDMTL